MTKITLMIVNNSRPNGPKRQFETEIDEPTLVKIKATTKWLEIANELDPLVPHGYHMVSYHFGDTAPANE